MIYTITVKGQPVPAPRMTRADRWKKRPCVLRYWDFRARVQETWLKKYGTKKLKKLMIGFRFYYTGHPVFDLDNLEKACEDSLKGFAYKDDNVQIIPKYKHTESFCVKENPRVELELEEIIEA